MPHFSVFNLQNKLRPWIIFPPLHNYVPLCVGLSHKIPIKYIYICDCNVTKCIKVQGVWILFQATVGEAPAPQVFSSHLQKKFLLIRVEVGGVDPSGPCSKPSFWRRQLGAVVVRMPLVSSNSGRENRAMSRLCSAGEENCWPRLLWRITRIVPGPLVGGELLPQATATINRQLQTFTIECHWCHCCQYVVWSRSQSHTVAQ